MGSKEIRKSGEVLFGPRWQTDLAKALDVESRRVRQWIAGDRKLPNTIYGDIIRLLKDRLSKIEAVLRSIERQIGMQQDREPTRME